MRTCKVKVELHETCSAQRLDRREVPEERSSWQAAFTPNWSEAMMMNFTVSHGAFQAERELGGTHSNSPPGPL